MKLPLNLYNVLIKKIKSITENNVNNNISNTNNNNNNNNVNINQIDDIPKNNSTTNNKVDINNQIFNNLNEKSKSNNYIEICPYDLYSKDREKFRQIILDEMEKVYNETKKTNQDENCLTVLYKIVSNLETNFEDKFKKISKTSKTYTSNIGLFQSSINFLKFVGFYETNEHFVLNDKIDKEGIKNLRFYMESFMIIKSKNF